MRSKVVQRILEDMEKTLGTLNLDVGLGYNFGFTDV